MATNDTTTIHAIRQKRYTLSTMAPMLPFTVRSRNFGSPESVRESLLYRLAYQNGVKSTGAGPPFGDLARPSRSVRIMMEAKSDVNRP